MKESNSTDPTQPTEETSTSIAIASETDDGEVATTPSAKNQDTSTSTSVEQPDNEDKDTGDVDSEDVDGEDDGGGKSLGSACIYLAVAISIIICYYLIT